MRFLILSIFAIVCSCAEDAVKLPPDAQTAIDKADADIAKVRQALIVTLSKCRTSAMKKDDLPGAMAIKAKVDELTEQVKPKVGDETQTEKPTSLVGTWQVMKANGMRKCMLQVEKNQTTVTEIPAGVTGVLRNGTITWSNGTSWILAYDKGAWNVTASDGPLTLQR